MSSRTPVLIVGGGVVGLSSALFLAWRGIPCLLVERHADLLCHPRARGFNPRTLELYRQVGLEPAILEARNMAWDPVTMPVLRAERLTSEQYTLIEPQAGEELASASPCSFCPIDQDRLEHLLRCETRWLGAEIRFSTELVSLEPDAEGVSAHIRDLGSGEEQELRAAYVIAADGWNSPIRRRLEIPVEGPGPLFHTLTLMFEADLSPALRGRRFVISYLGGPDSGAVLLPNDGQRRWTAGLPFDPARKEEYTEERCVELLRAAIGLPELEIRVVPQIPGTETKLLTFTIAAQVAARYREGRVFLAGDAAHAVPPTGGFGASLGIQDAHNLAWKLAAVLRGEAGAELLDTYEAERRPVAHFTLQQAVARSHDRMGAGPDKAPPLAPYASVVFGYQYRSAAIAAPEEGAAALLPHELEGRPGSRAPHFPVRFQGKELSMLDLYGRHFVLLAGKAGEAWLAAAGEAVPRVAGYRFGVELEDTEGRFAAAHGVGPEGALLVRPDGFVAWRSEGRVTDPARVLREVLDAVLLRR